MAMKPKKGDWEDVVGGDYVGRMREKGPRERESQLAFEMRMGALVEGRNLLLSWVRRSGSLGDAFLQLGIQSNNAGVWLKRLGFTRDELEAVKGTEVHRGLPSL